MNIKMLLVFILGMAVSDFVWWLRLKQDWALEEMIFYLTSGDISVFMNMGLINIYGFIFFGLVYIFLERRKRRVVGGQGK